MLMAADWPQRLPLQWHLNDLFDLALAYLLMPFFHSVDDLRRTLCITMGLSVTFSLTKCHANFCKMLFLKSLGFSVSLLAGGCSLTVLASLRSSSKAS